MQYTIDKEIYLNLRYREILDIASKERDIAKRQALFEYANEVLEKEFMSGVVNEGESSGYKI